MESRNVPAENELLAQIARGNEQGLSHLYDRYSRLLYSLILAILTDPRDAEEVLQEVFLQVWRQASRYDSRKGGVYRWLVTLARSRAIDRTRARNFSRRRNMELALDTREQAADTSRTSQLDALSMLERAEAVRIAFSKISVEQQQVMHLAYFLGHTQSEIARKLGIPLGTVKTRIRQGLISLQTLLAQELKP